MLYEVITDELRAWRERLRFDFGKFDYVYHGERFVLLDVNRTPVITSYSIHYTKLYEQQPGGQGEQPRSMLGGTAASGEDYEAGAQHQKEQQQQKRNNFV